jgi:predicted nucleotidyltransferase
MSASQKLVSHGVTSIGLFGSFTKGHQTPTSDVDILVDFAPDRHSFDNFMDLSFFLEDLFGRKVELVTPQSLSPHIGPYILQEVERVAIAA